MAALVAVLAGCGGGGADSEPRVLPAEVALGQRLFRETRFAQFFAARCGTNVNVSPPPADPVLATTITARGSLPLPAAGPTMSCSACHLSTEAAAVYEGGLRNFSDFAPRSPVPLRGDGLTRTTRNSPPLAGVGAARPGPTLLHFDGEYADRRTLVRETLLGRNLGWLLTEQDAAKAHVARVLREDDGRGALAADTGRLSYAALLRADPGIPAELVLPPALRIDVATASDDAVLDAAAALLDAYLASLDFGRDAGGDFAKAPYDLFLMRNGLPRRPEPGESDLAYSRRLRAAVLALTNPRFVTSDDGFYPHPFPIPFLRFEFAVNQLAGLKIFLAEPTASPPSPDELAQGGVGNCIACHHGPRFTDFLAHNVGIAQEEYDARHGSGAFAALAVPGLAERGADPDAFLPASLAHPLARGPFRRVAEAAQPGWADLGLWNVFANPDLPAPQAGLTSLLERVYGLAPGAAQPDTLLPLTIGLFKTLSLRSPTLGGPYFHDGGTERLEDVADHYREFSALARRGQVRNGDPRLLGIALVPADSGPLAAFLRSLNEDFE